MNETRNLYKEISFFSGIRPLLLGYSRPQSKTQNICFHHQSSNTRYLKVDVRHFTVLQSLCPVKYDQIRLKVAGIV